MLGSGGAAVAAAARLGTAAVSGPASPCRRLADRIREAFRAWSDGSPGATGRRRHRGPPRPGHSSRSLPRSSPGRWASASAPRRLVPARGAGARSSAARRAQRPRLGSAPAAARRAAAPRSRRPPDAHRRARRGEPVGADAPAGRGALRRQPARGRGGPRRPSRAVGRRAERPAPADGRRAGRSPDARVPPRPADPGRRRRAAGAREARRDRRRLRRRHGPPGPRSSAARRGGDGLEATLRQASRRRSRTGSSRSALVTRDRRDRPAPTLAITPRRSSGPCGSGTS
jgi:hypothetical protein